MSQSARSDRRAERRAPRGARLAEQLRHAQQRHRIPAHLDPQLEADALATMAAGLLTGMLVDTTQATAIIDYRLGQLFIDA